MLKAKVLVNETVWNTQYLLEEGLDIAKKVLDKLKKIWYNVYDMGKYAKVERNLSQRILAVIGS